MTAINDHDTFFTNYDTFSAGDGGILSVADIYYEQQTETADADNSDTFRFGMATSLLSAIVYAAFSFANISFICPDIFAAQMDQIMQAYSSLLDSNTMSQMEKMIGNMPQITFFTNLIYCFLYGMILSFILSRNIPSKDPFADYKPDEQ